MSTYLRLTSDLAAETPIAYAALGIVGDGKTYDHVGVENLQNAIDEGGIVTLGGAPQMLLGETVDWRKLRGKVFTSQRWPFPDGVNVPRFLWDGADGGTMMKWDRVHSCALEGIVVQTDRGPGYPQAGIGIDEDGSPFDETPPSSQYGSQCWLSRIRHLSVQPQPMTIARYGEDVPGPIFLSLAGTAQENHEYHHVIDCYGEGNGRGTFIYQGKSPNVVATRIKDIRNMSHYERGLFINGGFVYAEEINATRCEWPLWLGPGVQVNSIHRVHGEANAHWAYIDAPLESWGNKWDPEAAVPKDANGRGWIHFGPHTRHVELQGNLDKGRPAAATLFTFDNDEASDRKVEIDITTMSGDPMTRAQLGIDYQTLIGGANPNRQVRHLRFRCNPGSVSDLPSGALDFNWPAPIVEYPPAAVEWGVGMGAMGQIGSKPVDWARLTPGTSYDYRDTSSGYIRRQMCFVDGSYAEMPVGQYKKVKP